MKMIPGYEEPRVRGFVDEDDLLSRIEKDWYIYSE